MLERRWRMIEPIPDLEAKTLRFAGFGNYANILPLSRSLAHINRHASAAGKCIQYHGRHILASSRKVDQNNTWRIKRFSIGSPPNDC